MAFIQTRHIVFLLLAVSILFNVYLVTQLQSHLDENSGESRGGPPTQLVQKIDRTKRDSPITQGIRKNAIHWDDSAYSSAGLHCKAHGGPATLAQAAEMVYWRTNVPKDKRFHSSYATPNRTQYLVFQPDEAGFSNVRMSFETVVALAKATGRTLVLPPKTRLAQLKADPPPVRSYYLTDFFDVSDIPMISFQEFLEQKAMTGQLRDKSGSAVLPPENRTNWDGLIGNSQNAGLGQAVALWNYISSTVMNIDWQRDQCFVGFTTREDHNMDEIRQNLHAIFDDDVQNKIGPRTRIEQYTGQPIPVDAGPRRRMREMIAERRKLCTYNQTMMEADSLFVTGLEATGSRPLVQFYAYFFFDDWQQDLQMKRFVRDHLRFADHLQCAAARIVVAIREIARKNGNDDGAFDSMHVRRTDFALFNVYKDSLIHAEKLVEQQFFSEGRTVYIATDEKNSSFFDPFREHYNPLFLKDFMYLLEGVDANFYGMIEQLVIARGDKFVGTFYSTFSAYVNRIRGYHALKSKAPGHDVGALNSEYLGGTGQYRDVMKKYLAVHSNVWTREWPSAWRDIDHDLPQ